MTTDFESWIEKDLLQVNAFDIERVELKDYSIVNQGLQMRSDVSVQWDSTQAKWNLVEMMTYERGTPVPTQLLPSEKLNQSS